MYTDIYIIIINIILTSVLNTIINHVIMIILPETVAFGQQIPTFFLGQNSSLKQSLGQMAV